MSEPESVETIVRQMRTRLSALPAQRRHRSQFLGTYLRTTEEVGRAITAGAFQDARWVERWDVAFAELYLQAFDADAAGDTGQVSRPWQLAFAAAPELPALRHLLLGINAHVNYDLPQALLAVIPDQDWDNPALMATRRADHERIDGLLASRVKAEDAALGDPLRLIDRALQPLNRLSSKRFLREAREKVWLNTTELQQARVAGPERYAHRLAELEVLSAARIADLLRPGQVILRLAVAGFGVVLPPPRST